MVFVCFKVFSVFPLIALIHWLFRSVLFNFSVFVNFSVFFLLLICQFLPLWLGKILDIISVILNLLRLVLWSDTCSVMKSVPCEFEKNVFSGAVVGMFCVCMSVMVIWYIYLWYMVLLRAIVSLLIFCLDAVLKVG